MIGRRGFRTAEPPRATSSPARSMPVMDHRHRMRIALRPGARAPPESWPETRDRTVTPVPEMALGQRRRRQPRQTKLHPESTTERSQL
jgi:hypothetical protein